MSLRRAIIEADTRELNVTEFCRSHGVSTWFFWDLRRRHARDGDVVLTPRSRAAHRIVNRTTSQIEDAIVAKRKELHDAGLDSGAATIRFHLRDLDGVPAESTIWRILKARGHIKSDPSKAPKHSGRSFTAERANECWALDDTDWQLADGTSVKVLNVIDDHSRYCVAATAMPDGCTGTGALSVLGAAAVFLGWPTRFWSDNARAFRQSLAAALNPIGVAASHSRPYHPQSNGKIERFHQTLQKWLAKQPRAATTDELQHRLDTFRLIYNTQRPHRALERRFPHDVWTNAPKSGPSNQPLGTPTTIHHGNVTNGRVNAGPYEITVGAAHDTQQALTIITGTACHIFINGHLIRHLTINPNKRTQPLHNRPGRPTTLTKREAPRHP